MRLSWSAIEIEIPYTIPASHTHARTHARMHAHAHTHTHRHPALAGEPSQRYARALLDRELAGLLLIEAMLAVSTPHSFVCMRAYTL